MRKHGILATHSSRMIELNIVYFHPIRIVGSNSSSISFSIAGSARNDTEHELSYLSDPGFQKYLQEQ